MPVQQSEREREDIEREREGSRQAVRQTKAQRLAETDTKRNRHKETLYFSTLYFSVPQV